MRNLSLLETGLLLIASLTGCTQPYQSLREGPPRWAAYYDNALPASAFAKYHLLVFDARYHPDFSDLQPERTVLAYLSIGEVHGDSPLLPELQSRHAVIAHNAKWDSHIVDIRSPYWRAHLLEEALPEIVSKGFDGVMLDTADSVLDLENKPQFAGMKAATASLIGDIRARHPNLKIMVNRGFSVLPDIAGQIDYVLAESVQTRYDADAGEYRMTDPSASQPIYAQLQHLRAKYPHLSVYTLDYWAMENKKEVSLLYRAQRARGFIPYVTTPTLRMPHAEPTRGPSLSNTVKKLRGNHHA